MMILFWMLLFTFLIFFAYFFVMNLKMRSEKFRKRWGRVLTDDVEMEKIKINLMEKQIVNCFFYTSEVPTNQEKMPGIIVFPRKDKKYPYFEHWGAHFALQGYPTLIIEAFDKKLSSEEFTKKYRMALSKAKARLCNYERVDANSLVYFGMDVGATLMLLEGLPDEDVKVICGISVPLIDDYIIKQWNNSRKVCLVHAKDDKIIPIEDFQRNKELLGLKEGDYIVFNQGGHYLLSSEHSAATFFSIKIRKNLNVKYKQIEPKSFH